MQNFIAVTDDDPSIRKILNIMLSKEGYSVLTFSNAEELFSSLKKDNHSPIEIIIMDIKMPGLSGLEAIPVIKKTKPDIPIIMLTAFNNLDTGMSAIRYGAFDYLSKPVRKQELFETIKRAHKKVITDRNSKMQKHANDVYNSYLKKQIQTQTKELNNAYHKIMRSTIDMIAAFSETIEQKDVYTKGHCGRVREISMKIAGHFNLSDKELTILEGGALLHDIGKIGIPENILNKIEPLSNEEFGIIQSHPLVGEKILSHVDFFSDYLPIIRNHHERYDGTGYPDGLSGSDIPLLVRIVSIADAFDAMMSDRAYRTAFPMEKAVSEIEANKGTQFDPNLVDIFLKNKIYTI
ncbi:MAG: response regulator [Spirochaetia bacterium]|nr:response regulator [Spirochaetia bacterium]